MLDQLIGLLAPFGADLRGQYLRQAREPHRPQAEQREQIRLALHAFTGAAAGAPDDALGRSAARVYQAVCWACLGSPEDLRRRLEEAATDAYADPGGAPLFPVLSPHDARPALSVRLTLA